MKAFARTRAYFFVKNFLVPFNANKLKFLKSTQMLYLINPFTEAAAGCVL